MWWRLLAAFFIGVNAVQGEIVNLLLWVIVLILALPYDKSADRK